MGKADRQGGDTRSASQARAQERMKAQAAANRPPATKEQLDEAIKQAMMEPQSIEIGRLHYNRVKQMGASQEELDILAQSMSTLPIGDNATSPSVSVTVYRDSREDVDATALKGIAAGGAEPQPADDYGFMYTRQVNDPDGNVIQFGWMDPAGPQS